MKDSLRAKQTNGLAIAESCYCADEILRETECLIITFITQITAGGLNDFFILTQVRSQHAIEPRMTERCL